jgi:hypothetical protein
MGRNRIIAAACVYIFLLINLAGCSLDRWEEVAAGEYMQTSRVGVPNQSGRGVIQRMEVNRQDRMVTLFLDDGSVIRSSFASRDKQDWPAGCPTNFYMTHMEVLDLKAAELTIGSYTFREPILARNCPGNPERVVLRSDGEMGGSGTACANTHECIYFKRPGAQ